MLGRSRSFHETLTAAVQHFAERGYTVPEELDRWLADLRRAAETEAIPDAQLREQLRRSLGAIYDRMVERGGLLREFRGVSRFGFERLKPTLRAELTKRVMASAELIRLNREATIADTLRRFAGWATSVPPGGDDAVRRNVVKSDVRKALASLPYEARRVNIDQGAKFAASLREVTARDAGAIAVRWHHIPPRPSYQSRPDHLALDGQVFALRDNNWALERGLMKAGPAGYYEDTDRFAVKPYCSCHGTWLTALSRLPDDLLTQAGRDELAAPTAA